MNYNPSKLCNAPEGFTFDDFVLEPVHSAIPSRKFPDVSVGLPGLTLATAVMAAPMNTITEEEMVLAMVDQGATAVLHRFMSLETQLNVCRRLQETRGRSAYWVAVGATKDYLERVQELKKLGVDKFCIDVANGHSDICVSAVRTIASKVPGVQIFAGNVCTFDGAMKLADAGASVIRVGIGPGSMCTTRVVTGHGVPQLTAIEECALIKGQHPQVAIVADGGLRGSGDLVKAFAIGADAVMIGSLLKATKETPGDIIEEGGKRFKYYSGMASEEGRANWFDRTETGFVPEGVSTKVPYEGKTVEEVMAKLIGGLKVGMSYSNASNIKELRKNAKWRRVSSAGFVEGTPHGR